MGEELVGLIKAHCLGRLDAAGQGRLRSLLEARAADRAFARGRAAYEASPVSRLVAMAARRDEGERRGGPGGRPGLSARELVEFNGACRRLGMDPERVLRLPLVCSLAEWRRVHGRA